MPTLEELDISRSTSLFSKSSRQDSALRKSKLSAFASLLQNGNVKILKMRSARKQLAPLPNQVEDESKGSGKGKGIELSYDSRGRLGTMVGPEEMDILAQALSSQCSLEKLE